MKKYLVIGNPIKHSLSPALHNYWFKKEKINAMYEKKQITNNNLKDLISRLKKDEIDGINVTVPFKKEIIQYLDKLSPEAEETQSVNTIYNENGNVIGHNTDIKGFELAIKDTKYDVSNKKVLILGAGGVVPSIIYALQKMNFLEVLVCNRTKDKAENLKNLFENIKIVDWGQLPTFDMIINATSIGLKNSDIINLDFSKVEKGKFFYDVIYNPKETNFLKEAKKKGNKTENGRRMFIYQAAAAFKIWHGNLPAIDDEIDRILD